VHRTTAQPSGLWVRLAQLFSHTHTGVHGVVDVVVVCFAVEVVARGVVVGFCAVVVVAVVVGQSRIRSQYRPFFEYWYPEGHSHNWVFAQSTTSQLFGLLWHVRSHKQTGMHGVVVVPGVVFIVVVFVVDVDIGVVVFVDVVTGAVFVVVLVVGQVGR